jgi:DNA-binding MarR family transcriptional regulator
MKLSPSQIAVLQMLVDCNEPLAYFKGGFWTVPSRAKEISERGYKNRQWITMGTVQSMEKKDLLAQTGTSTNYPIEHYPNLSDRVLTEAGLAAAQQSM